MIEPNLIGGFMGGVLIGLAAVLLLALNGRIAGISGIFGGIITSHSVSECAWRVAFVVGLVAGAALYIFFRASLPLQLQAPGLTLIAAGLLVGFGTRIGSGCTSGHGVCGLGRRSPRSFAATIIFMTVAALTVFFIHHVL